MKSICKGPCPSSCSFLPKLTRQRATWSVFSNGKNCRYTKEKETLRKTLLDLQGYRCVYCERVVTEKNATIEHFVPRGKNDKLTFDWNNLFISCDSADSCGHYKDGPQGKKIKLAQMFRPDTPELRIENCFECEDGVLRPIDSLTNRLRELAKGTICKTNLNHPRLVFERHALIKLVLNYVDPVDWKPYISADEIRSIFKSYGFDSLLEQLIRQYFE